MNFENTEGFRRSRFFAGRRLKVAFTSVIAAASVLAVAPGLTTFPGDFGSPVAQAAITGFRDAPPASSIDMNQPVNLTLMIPDLRNGEPRDKSELPLGGVAGYSVTVTKLDVAPINTEEGYKAAAGLTSADLKNVGKGDSFTAVTDENGVARFEGLEPGAYLVTARPPKDSTKYYPQPQDMVIVVPTVTEDGTWNYQPTVVAKFVPEDCECPPDQPCPPPTTPGPTPPPVTTTPGKPSVPGPPPPVTKTPPRVTTTPAKPGSSKTTPAKPGSSATTPAKPGSSTSSGGPLAITGVQAAGLVGVAAVLIGSGAVLITTKRKPREEEDEV